VGQPCTAIRWALSVPAKSALQHTPWDRIRRELDLTPLFILIVLYGAVQWLPFGIFGWVQNEDGLLEWGSVAILGIAAANALRLLRQSKASWTKRLGWALFLGLCVLFIGEEISWGERLHGYGIEAIRAVNTQGETNLHNISGFQHRGLLHLGWAAFGLALGLIGWLTKPAPLVPDRRLCLYFLIPAFWYVGFEFCRKAGTCLVTVANHQEIYEFIIALGLLMHARIWAKRSNNFASEK